MNVLVTGISRGLGLITAEVLLKRSDYVYGICRNSSNELEDLIQKYPDTLKVLHFDLSNIRMIKGNVFQRFISNSVPLEGFVDNAAIAYDDLITNINIDDLQNMFTVNSLSPLILTKYVIRNMLFNCVQGSIVHISSICVHTGYKGLAMYAASKGAIEAFSKNVAREWGAKGIRSNVVVPGFMETSMSSSLSEDLRFKIYNRTSLKAATEISSVAETVAFLLSTKAESITGQNIYVDSGTI